eukprot:7430_1
MKLKFHRRNVMRYLCFNHRVRMAGVIPHDYSQEHLHYLSKNPEYGYKEISGAYNDFDPQMFTISFCCLSKNDIRLQWFINGWNMRISKKANFTKIWQDRIFCKNKGKYG